MIKNLLYRTSWLLLKPPIHKRFPEFLEARLPPFILSPGLWQVQTLPRLLRGRAFDPRWPIRAPHSPGHRDWLETGMVPRERPIRDLETQFSDFC